MRRLFLRWLVATVAIYAAVELLPGISFRGPWWRLALVAIIFGLVNALIRPLLTFLTCPLIVLTLGLFLLIINAGMLMLTARLSEHFGLQFHVASFRAAFWGAIVISVVSFLLNLLLGDDDKED
jgi:putative membrane protein